MKLSDIKNSSPKREHGECFICGKNRKVIRHHICYEPEKTIPLCKKCHGLTHTQVTQFNPFPQKILCRKYRFVDWSVIFPSKASGLQAWAYGFREGLFLCFEKVPQNDFTHLIAIDENRANTNTEEARQLAITVADMFGGKIYAHKS